MRSVSKILAATCLSALTIAPAFAAEKEPTIAPNAPVVRRLTPDQYKQAITDIFGETISIGGRFEPDVRADGLLAVGAGKVSVTSTGFEQYDAIARGVADQVVAEPYRSILIPCKPAELKKPDDACAKTFLGQAGRLLFRRPLTGEELAGRVKVAHDAAVTMNSFYDGLSISLSTLLQSSQFLFVRQEVEPDPVHPGEYRLTGYSKATQLSLFFWNGPPDDDLIAAAENGELHTPKGVQRQVERLLASPRLTQGVRAFFSDMLGFDKFQTLDKDPAVYPKFTTDVANESAEQTLRTITDLVLTQGGDYRDLFTVRKTFLTPMLSTIYGVPFVTRARNGAPTHWIAHEYPEGDARAGILSQISFVSLHAHPGRSSPTLRGKALRESILCQRVPDPPGNVDFSVVQDTSNEQYKTARDRLLAHQSTPVCAGCHKITDPMGFALENFDSDGSYRTMENKTKIDASGVLDGITFNDAAGLGKAVHDNPATANCLVRRLYSYSQGRAPGRGETDYLYYLQRAFAESGYRIPALMRTIATSDAFFKVEPVDKSRADARTVQ